MRVFSLEEANASIPALKDALGKIFCLNEVIGFNINDTNALLELWGEELHGKNHVDHEYYQRLLQKHDELIKDLQDRLKDIHDIGCILKDMEKGLVDFYCGIGDEIVFLCWKYGEESVRHWHPVNAGFSNRRPISELFAMNR